MVDCSGGGYLVETLSDLHDRQLFSCGNQHLDEYFRKRILTEMEAGICRVFVLVSRASGQTVGFYTLSNSTISLDLLPDEKRRQKGVGTYSAVPATLIGRFAVDDHFRGQGLGAVLLLDSLRRIWRAAQDVGSWAVVVSTRDQQAKRFWEHHEFRALPEASNTLYLQIAALGELFASARG